MGRRLQHIKRHQDRYLIMTAFAAVIIAFGLFTFLIYKIIVTADPPAISPPKTTVSAKRTS